MQFIDQLSCFFVWKVPGSNFRSDTAYLFSFSSVPKRTARQNLESGHDQIYPFPFKFIVYQRSHYSTSEPLAASLGKGWKVKFALEETKLGPEREVV